MDNCIIGYGQNSEYDNTEGENVLVIVLNLPPLLIQRHREWLLSVKQFNCEYLNICKGHELISCILGIMKQNTEFSEDNVMILETSWGWALPSSGPARISDLH